MAPNWIYLEAPVWSTVLQIGYDWVDNSSNLSKKSSAKTRSVDLWPVLSYLETRVQDMQ